jgi:hypothetical protein
MPWTYDSELGTTKDLVRLTIGDTNSRDEQLQDEEIQVFLDANSDDVLSTAKQLVRILIAKYARGVDKWVGDLKTLASQRVDHYKALLEVLEGQESTGLGFAGVPTAGGVYSGEKQLQEAREDLAKPSFVRGVHDIECEGLRRVQ